jgi:hypothetical protein
MDPTQLAKIFDPATAIVITMLIIGIGALASGKLVVPRFIYDRERDRADKGEDTLEKLTDLLEDYNSQLRQLRRGGDRDA